MVPDLTPEQILAEASKPDTSFMRVKELYAMVNDTCPGVVMVINGAESQLLPVLKRIGDERLTAEQEAARKRAAAELPAVTKDLGDWALAIEEIAKRSDRERAEQTVKDALESGVIDEVKAKAIERAIAVKIASLPADAGKVAA
jgi:hypothetical protein